MGALLLPSRFAQQPTEYTQLNMAGMVRRPVAAFVPSLIGLRILGEGKHDIYGKSTGPGFAPAMATYGVSAKGTTSTTSTIRLNALANQFDTVWEKPSTQVTVMLVFKRTGTPAGTAPIFSNQCPNNDPFCAWGLFDQITDFAGFETSSGGVNKRLNSSIAIPNNQLVVLIGRYDGAKMELFQNSIKVGTLAATGSLVYPNVSDRGPSVGNFYNFTGNNRSAMMEVYGGALWDAGISDAEIAALSQSPWQIFSAPTRRLWSSLVGTATDTPVNPVVGAVSLTGFVPTVARTANQAVAPNTGSLTLTGYSPSISRTANQASSPAVGSLSIAGYAPTISQAVNVAISPLVGSLSITGYAPSVARTVSTSISPNSGVLALAGYAPTIAQTASSSLSPASGQLALTGYAPSVMQTAPIVTLKYRFISLKRDYNTDTIHFSG